jgi:hypothetical protein
MRLLIALLLLPAFATCAAATPWAEHKSEAELAQMTPAQRVDAWVEEQVHHRYDLDDAQSGVIKKYLLRDGTAALPRLVEIMDEYDPTRFPEGKGRRGERFDACWLMLSYIDRRAVRLRASAEGRRAMEALERAVQRMRAAGYGQPDQHDWAEHGRFDLAMMYLEEARGINDTDRTIQNTLRLEYKILLSDEELLAFSNFMTSRYPNYPSWSERDFTQDDKLNAAGFAPRVLIMKQPGRFYEAYREFKNSQR